MTRVHVLLTGLSLVIVSLSVNRLGSFTQAPLEPYGFLRWLDVNAMLPIPIASIVLYYLLKKDIERAGEAAPRPSRARRSTWFSWSASIFLASARVITRPRIICTIGSAPTSRWTRHLVPL